MCGAGGSRAGAEGGSIGGSDGMTAAVVIGIKEEEEGNVCFETSARSDTQDKYASFLSLPVIPSFLSFLPSS